MRYAFLVSAFVSYILPSFAQQRAELEVMLKNNVFYAPATGTYVETDMRIPGNSIKYVQNERGEFMGTLEVILLFKKGDHIVNYDKYLLHTLEIADTLGVSIDVLDKKRYALPPGNYTFDATITDVISKHQQHVIEPLTINIDSNKAQFSDISLVNSCKKVQDEGNTGDDTLRNKTFIKSGLYMTPMVINFFPQNISMLRFYAEVYNANGSGDSLLFTYSIRNEELNEELNNYSSFSKIVAKPVIPLFGELDISDLSSGNYELLLQIKDKKNNQVCQKRLSFQRSKAEKDTTTTLTSGDFINQLDAPVLKYQLRTLGPIADYKEAAEIKELGHSIDVDSMKQFLIRFWSTRDAANPYHEWVLYENQVAKANQQFGTSTNYGFETDRGRVYLEYGPPNQLADIRSEPSAFPYQIWQYYNIPGQGQAKFVFYERSLATNNYELIHSTARDEIRNEEWEKLVYQGVGTVSPTDLKPQVPDQWGSKATERYQNP